MTTDDLQQTIMHTIRTNRIVMIPRIHFFARTGLFLAGVGLALVASIFVVSFIHFTLRDNGLLELPRFGAPGVVALMGQLPWFSILFSIAMVVFLEILASHFSYVYKRPLVYSIIVGVVIVVVGGTLVARTSLHESAFRLSHEGKLPGIAPFYQRAMYNPPNVTIGTITDMPDEHTAKLLTREGLETVVMISAQTKLPNHGVGVGDTIVVFGEPASSTIHAIGIRPFDPERIIFPRAQRPQGFGEDVRRTPQREIPRPLPVY